MVTASESVRRQSALITASWRFFLIARAAKGSSKTRRLESDESSSRTANISSMKSGLERLTSGRRVSICGAAIRPGAVRENATAYAKARRAKGGGVAWFGALKREKGREGEGWVRWGER